MQPSTATCSEVSMQTAPTASLNPPPRHCAPVPHASPSRPCRLQLPNQSPDAFQSRHPTWHCHIHPPDLQEMDKVTSVSEFPVLGTYPPLHSVLRPAAPIPYPSPSLSSASQSHGGCRPCSSLWPGSFSNTPAQRPDSGGTHYHKQGPKFKSQVLHLQGGRFMHGGVVLQLSVSLPLRLPLSLSFMLTLYAPFPINFFVSIKINI